MRARGALHVPVRAVVVAACILACASVGPSGTPMRRPVTLPARPASDTATQLSSAERQLDDVLARVKAATTEKDRFESNLAKLLAQLDQTRHDIESTTATLVD